MTDIAPKYFDVENINTLNVGLYGQVNETMATTTEDVFNTISTYINELIPIRATMPSSIYGYATSVQLKNLFASPARVATSIFININNIINENTRRGNKYVFNLDRNMEVFVEDIKFMLDYDIEIIAKPYQGRFIYTARYIMDHDNVISDIRNPYIRAGEIKFEGSKYLAMAGVFMHQVTRYNVDENIINNTVLNAPVLSFEFEGEQLAGFNVFYKDPAVDKLIQLELKNVNSPPTKKPFCYYRFKNDSEIELSFTTKDFYFKPELNSNIIIEYMTTLGSRGVFDKYTGGQIHCIPKSEKWDYNNNLIMFAHIESASEFGFDMPTLDQIKALYIEKMTSVDSYTTDEDLNIHFKNFVDKANNVTRFIKTRDDMFRTFTGYGILKDVYSNVYPTNTVDTRFETTDFDNDPVAKVHIIKPGRLFKYKGSSNTEVEVINGTSLKDDITSLVNSNEFLYTNPFLMMISKNPSSVGYYLNSVDRSVNTEYKYVNGDSVAQFMCNSFSIFRNAHDGSNKYHIKAHLVPTMELEEKIMEGGVATDVLKPKLILHGDDGSYYSYVDFKVVEHNKAKKYITIEANVNTDDTITLSRKFLVKNMKEYESHTVKDLYLPMVGCKTSIAVFYKLDGPNINHDLTIPDVSDYTLTNIYTTDDEHVDWITPLTSMNSHFTFLPGASPDAYKISLKNIPMVRATTLKDKNKGKDFIYRIWAQQRFIREALPKITNNFSIDIKFYNTYGRARNLTVGEDMSTLLNRVNLKINFLIKPKPGTPIDELIRDLKIFIKAYVEDINSNIFNSFHISNLIRHIENAFPDIDYMNFQKINEYDSKIQTIVPKYIELETMPKDIKSDFVPEYLTTDVDDITLTII